MIKDFVVDAKGFFADQFFEFGLEDINPKPRIMEAVRVFLYWSVPAFVFVLWSNIYRPEVEYYQLAIKEAVGPHLWNLMGGFGFLSFCISIILPKYKFPAKAAREILLSTYAMGSLNFGIHLALFFVDVDLSEFVWWQVGLFGVTSGFLILILIYYNFALWYLGFLIRNDESGRSSFSTKMGNMSLLWRLSIGLTLAVPMSLLLYYQ